MFGSRINIKSLLYSAFIILLCLPLVQMIYPFKEVLPLKGAVVNAEKPQFKTSAWFDGTYQDGFEKYLNDSIGFRPWLIKLHNQIQFSAFGQVSASGVIRGKENYLYELNYIKAYNGEDFIGSKAITEKVKKIKYLQDRLSAFNKTLLICLAPGKGSFYPEYIPDNLTKPHTDSTNLKQYLKILKKNDVNYIDMNSWFRAMKDTCNCMLYPKYGIHWSHYGMLLAVDSLINYIEQKRNIIMPHIEFSGITHSSELQYTDYDIAEGMNLLFQMHSEPMCYPDIKFITPENSIKPKTLVVSDSFYWSMFNISVGRQIFSYGGFWYYNKQIYPNSYDSPITVDDVDIEKKVLDNDVIIIMSTNANLPELSWGFIDKLYGILSSNKIHLEKINTSNQKDEELKQMVQSIRNNKDWFNSIKKKAASRNISIDSMLVIDANWMLENEK